MNKTKEIKKILMGNIVVNERGYIQLRPKLAYTGFNGFLEGWFWVLCFGVMSRTRRYHCDYAPAKAMQFVEEYVQKMGRPLQLLDNPDVIACLTGYPIITPGVLAVELLEDESKKEQQEDTQEDRQGEKKTEKKKDKKKPKGTDIRVTFCTGRTPLAIVRSMVQLRRFHKKLGDLFERVTEV